MAMVKALALSTLISAALAGAARLNTAGVSRSVAARRERRCSMVSSRFAVGRPRAEPGAVLAGEPFAFSRHTAFSVAFRTAET